MENDYNKQDREAVFSKRVRAGKRTYFFDVRTTRANDFYLTITESTKRPGEERFVKHKIFFYKEDFKKFMDGLNESTGYIREQLPGPECDPLILQQDVSKTDFIYVQYVCRHSFARLHYSHRW